MSGDNTWTGSVTLADTSTVTVDAGSTLTFTGLVVSGGNARKAGSGTLILSGTSTTANYMDVNAGVVSVRSDTAAIGGYFHVFNAASAVELQGGVSIPATKRIYLSGIPANDNPSFRSVSGNNTWNGIVTLHVGTGNHNIGVDAGSTLTLAGTVDEQSPPDNLVKVGDGVLILNGGSSYSGTTTVKAGTLLVNSSIGSSAVTVQTGATLGGTGPSGPVTIDAGGNLSPGNSPGIYTSNGNYVQNGTLAMEVLNATGGAGVGYDQVRVLSNGSVTLGGTSVLTLNYTGAAGAFNPSFGQVFTLIDNDGSVARRHHGHVQQLPGRGQRRHDRRQDAEAVLPRRRRQRRGPGLGQRHARHAVRERPVDDARHGRRRPGAGRLPDGVRRGGRLHAAHAAAQRSPRTRDPRREGGIGLGRGVELGSIDEAVVPFADACERLERRAKLASRTAPSTVRYTQDQRDRFYETVQRRLEAIVLDPPDARAQRMAEREAINAELEKRGLIRRTRGGAALLPSKAEINS